MASDPHLRHYPERLRESASRAAHGPVRPPLTACLGSTASFPRLRAASQLAKLSRVKATPHTFVPTEAARSPQSRPASVGTSSCTSTGGAA
jgi:hypothetical protein